MSTLKVNNLQDINGGNNSTPEQVAQGRAKAWVNFSGQTVTSATDMTGVGDSFNISSVVDNGLGHYTLNFTVAFSNTNYCYTDSGNGTSGGNRELNNVTQNTNSFTFKTRGTSVAAFDPTTVCLAFFGDQ